MFDNFCLKIPLCLFHNKRKTACNCIKKLQTKRDKLKISKLDGKVKASVPQNFKERLPPVESKSGVKYKNNFFNESVVWLFETASRMIKS